MTVPGLVLTRPLDPGRPGPPWRAKDVRSGYDVVLREVLAASGSEPDLDELAQRISRLPDHPHLLVPALHLDVSGRPVLATRYCAHRGIDRLLAGRAGLGPGEVSTVAVAVGRALAALHSAGCVHGSVAASTILLGARGRLFLDTTASLTRPAAASVTPEHDVIALARLLTDSVAAPVPVATAEVLRSGCGGELGSAGELVRLLVAAAAPQPLDLVEGQARPGADGARRPAARLEQHRRRYGRRGAGARRLGRAVAAVGLVAVGGIVVGAGLLHGGRQPTPGVAAHVSRPAGAAPSPATVVVPVTSAVSSGVDWAGLLADLDDRRGQAFSTGDAGPLIDVDAAGSAVLTADLRALHQLTAAGLHASGFAELLRSVRVVILTASRVVLHVVDVRPAYRLVRSADGALVASVPPRGPVAWRVELVLAAAGWQVRSVRLW